jgi:hypothetical protein
MSPSDLFHAFLRDPHEESMQSGHRRHDQIQHAIRREQSRARDHAIAHEGERDRVG